jgi:hypothetical protein
MKYINYITLFIIISITILFYINNNNTKEKFEDKCPPSEIVTGFCDYICWDDYSNNTEPY